MEAEPGAGASFEGGMLGELMLIMGMLQQGKQWRDPLGGSTRGRLLPAPLSHVGGLMM